MISICATFERTGQARRALGVVLVFVLLATSACQPSPQERYSRAEGYFDAANYAAAILELRNAIQDDPNFAEARFLLGRASFYQADFETAKAETERALSLGMDSPEVWEHLAKSLLAVGDAASVVERVVPNLAVEGATASQLAVLGGAYLALGNEDEASTLFSRALELDSANANALIGKAVIATGTDDIAAQDFIQKAIDLNPAEPIVWRAQGNLLREKREHSAAAEAYKNAIDVETPATPVAERLTVRIDRITALLNSAQLDEADDAIASLDSSFPGHPATTFLRGRSAYEKKDYPLAQSELQNYLAKSPNDLWGHALLGAVNLSQNQLRQAEIYLARAERGNVGGAATSRMLAETRLRLRKPGEALTTLGGLDRGAEVDSALLAMFGRAQLGLGNKDAAIDYFERGVTVAEGDSKTSLALATGFIAANENRRAIELLSALPRDSKNRIQETTLLLAAYLRDGQDLAALEAGEQLLLDRPEDPDAYATVGVLKQSLQDDIGARANLERALALDPVNIAAKYSLSHLEAAAGNLQRANQLLGEVLDASPAHAPALASLSTTLIAEQRFDELRQRIDAAVRTDTDSLLARLILVRLELSDDNSDAAIQVIADAKEVFPDDPRLFHAEALAMMQNGQIEGALSSIRRAVNADEQNAAFQFDLAVIGLRSGELETAESAINNYRLQFPDDYRGLVTQSTVYDRLGNTAAARQNISEFIERNPDNQAVTVLAGDVEMLAGNFALAVDYYETAAESIWNRDVAGRLAQSRALAGRDDFAEPLERWLDSNPEDAEMRRFYGQILQSEGDTQSAMSQYELALRENGDDPIALNNLAWQYALDGNVEAVRFAERAHELAPDNGSITDTLGWILFQQGNIDRALPIIEQAASQSPQNLEIQFHLAAVYAEVGKKTEARDIIERLLGSDQPFPSRPDAASLIKSL